MSVPSAVGWLISMSVTMTLVSTSTGCVLEPASPASGSAAHQVSAHAQDPSTDSITVADQGLATATAAALAAAPPPLAAQLMHARPLSMTEAHRHRLAHYGKVHALAFGAHHELYMLTPHHLWLYDLSTQVLKSLVLRVEEVPSDKETPAKIIPISQIISWTAADKNDGTEQAYLLNLGHALFVLEQTSTPQVMKLEVPTQGFIGAGLLGPSRSFVTQDSLWIMDEGMRVVSRWGLPDVEHFYDLVSPHADEVQAMARKHPLSAMRVAYTADQRLIFYTQRHIWLWQPAYGGDSHAQLAAVAQPLQLIGSYLRDIQHIQVDGDVLIVQTPAALIVMDLTGQIIKLIDVAKVRRLQLAWLGERKHMFLFDDHHLEMYDLAKEKIWYVTLAFDKSKRISAWARHGDNVAMVVDGQVKLMELSLQAQAVAQDEGKPRTLQRF